jgi:prepilin-type N-terminal cleavage/methylation domain-containing protein
MFAISTAVPARVDPGSRPDGGGTHRQAGAGVDAPDILSLFVRPSPSQTRAFSLLEVLISLAIIAILVGLLVPTLIHARDAARATLCAGNLRQIGGAWQLYISAHDRFPRHAMDPEWNYGGVQFRGVDRRPILAADRPINQYLAEEDEYTNQQYASLFRCPSDVGVFMREGKKRGPSILENGGTCYSVLGTSYLANPYVVSATSAGPEPRALRVSEVQVSASRLLIVGDPEWFYATRNDTDPASQQAAFWHTYPRAGNFLALDGSVHFRRYGSGEDSVALYPRPQGPK